MRVFSPKLQFLGNDLAFNTFFFLHCEAYRVLCVSEAKRTTCLFFFFSLPLSKWGCERDFSLLPVGPLAYDHRPFLNSLSPCSSILPSFPFLPKNGQLQAS